MPTIDKQKLTHQYIVSLEPNADGKHLHSKNESGLFLLVSKHSKTFKYRYRWHGKPQTYTIGPFPLISLAKARAIRDDLKRLQLNGKNPNQAKKDAKLAELKQRTFKSIADEYFDKRGLENFHIVKARSRLRKYAYPSLGNKLIGEIESPMIVSLIRCAEEKNKGDTAKRVLAVVRQVFNYARASGLLQYNPAEGIQAVLNTAQKKNRPHELDPQKIGKLLNAIDGLDVYQPARAINQLLPMLFCRKIELLGARWEEVDWEKKQLTVPVNRMKITKNGSLIIPLPRQAIAILRELRPYTHTERAIYLAVHADRAAQERTHTHKRRSG